MIRSFGFTKHDVMEMFQKQSTMLSKSEEHLKLGLDFFLNKIELQKERLVRAPPHCLLHSLGERVIPRYRVMQILKSKRLLKKEPSFVTVLKLCEKEFLDKYVAKFTDATEELLVAYKGHLLDSEMDTAIRVVLAWLLLSIVNDLKLQNFCRKDFGNWFQHQCCLLCFCSVLASLRRNKSQNIILTQPRRKKVKTKRNTYKNK
ncbi:hypothetical protein ACOSP7_021914 [Xanthoceras sorbifolium]